MPAEDGSAASYGLYPRRRTPAGQYVVNAVRTNTIEGFWSLIKRGMVGTFHKVSHKYLPLYVAEFQFRYNCTDEDCDRQDHDRAAKNK
jgi:hypothetical protein